MSYRRGTVLMKTREDAENYEHRDVDVGEVFLPHSCDEWVIGRAAEVRVMIEDLMVLLREMES